jgi:beta-phosphoglucomutase-like phosphatase (HAD superfamily)
MTETQFNLFEARRLRDEAIETVSTGISREEWIERGRRIARDLAYVNGFVTSDLLVKHWPPPDGVDHRIIGAVFNARKLGLVKTGYTQCSRKQGHARPMAVWRLK